MCLCQSPQDFMFKQLVLIRNGEHLNWQFILLCVSQSTGIFNLRLYDCFVPEKKCSYLIYYLTKELLARNGWSKKMILRDAQRKS